MLYIPPVVEFGLVRLFVILVVCLSWQARHSDIKAAFLNGDIDREIFEKHPVNFAKTFASHKSLYGLHQAPFAWFKKLMRELLRLGYEQLASDGSVFIRPKSNHSVIIILDYVDDTIFPEMMRTI